MPETEMAYSLRLLDPESPLEVAVVTQMHLDLLKWGPIAKLGRLFLRRYCYTVLVREGLMKAGVYDVAGRPAGFVVYTARPREFLPEAVRRHPWRVAFLALTSLVLRPRAAVGLVKAVRATRCRLKGETSLPPGRGEILAIGVYPEYRSTRFVRSTGLHLGRELFAFAASGLRAQGCTSMQLDVDAFNREALLFYHTLGGRFRRFDRCGDPMYRITFDLQE